VQERLQRAGLDGRVAVRGEDRSGRLVLRFLAVANGEPGKPALLDPLEPALRALMAGFALAWEIG